MRSCFPVGSGTTALDAGATSIAKLEFRAGPLSAALPATRPIKRLLELEIILAKKKWRVQARGRTFVLLVRYGEMDAR
jgi:hypothetical protein